MKTTEKINDVRVHLKSDDGDTYAEMEGSVDLSSEDAEAFLHELGQLVRRYDLGRARGRRPEQDPARARHRILRVTPHARDSP